MRDKSPQEEIRQVVFRVCASDLPQFFPESPVSCLEAVGDRNGPDGLAMAKDQDAVARSGNADIRVFALAGATVMSLFSDRSSFCHRATKS